MLNTMPRPKKDTAKKLVNPEQVLIRMDKETQSAFEAYLAAQDVAPERPAVVLAALREFLVSRKYLPPKPTT
jgi:hypothetical protein